MKPSLKTYHNNRSALWILYRLLIPALVILTITQDFLKTSINDSAFYFSESLMFSSFWWLFIPLFFAQCSFLQKAKTNRFVLWSAGFVLPVMIHLLAFPLLIRIISGLFYYHTYSVTQTLTYTLSDHFYHLVIGYAASAIVVLFSSQKMKSGKTVITEAPAKQLIAPPDPVFLSSLVIAEGNKRISIAVADIFYCTANTPYIDIQLSHKKYLHSETLKSIGARLDNRYFVRIHKSTLVNLAHIRSYSSRQNGDYDLTMNNGALLRVSRHYAADFKRRLQENTPLTR